MIHFVTSWYNTEGFGGEVTPSYQAITPAEFDETVSQTNIFISEHEQVQLMVLNYQPHLRSRLNRQQLTHVPYWNPFDVIQEADPEQMPEPFDIHDFTWPAGYRILPGVFNLIVLDEHDETIAFVDLSHEGYISKILWYEQGQHVRTYQMDDRGFLSRVIQHGTKEQIYYNAYGEAVMQISPDSVQILTHQLAELAAGTYPNIESVIQRLVTHYLGEQSAETHTVVIASEARHNRLFDALPDHVRVVYSYSSNRASGNDLNAIQLDEQTAALMVADTEELAAHLRVATNNQVPIVQISPYDTRLSLGESQRKREVQIYFNIGNTSPHQWGDYLTALREFIISRARVEILIVGDKATEQQWAEWITDLNTELGLQMNPLLQDATQLNTDPEQEEPVQYRVVQTEQDVQRLLNTARVVVDLRQSPDLYTQIASISAGVPQINRIQTHYVNHQQNGYLVDDPQTLVQALSYYLDQLHHWNEALVYNVQEIESHTSGRIVQRWREELEGTYHGE